MAMAAAINKWRVSWLVVVTICVLLVPPIGIQIYQSLRGIRITIHNSGSTPLGSAVLHIAAQSYPLGDIAAGESANITIYPGGKSHLEIEFIDVDGKPKRLDAGGYFTGNMKGTIRISIKDAVIDENVQKVTLSYW